MEKEKLYSFAEAIQLIETFLLNRLHKEKNIKMKIKTPPRKNALAWFDATDDGLYITDDLSKWTPELLYVLPLHENTHKVLYGLVENYENGYHNIAFRNFFEKYSGMRTYHDEHFGWQFIQNVGGKYITWLEQQKENLNEIFKVIKNTDLPKKENEQEGEQDGGNGGQDGGQEDESEADKMNKILRANEQNGEQEGEQESGQEGEQSDGENNEQSDEQKGDQEGESGDQESESGEQDGGEYEGQKQDVVLKGGKKKFRL